LIEMARRSLAIAAICAVCLVPVLTPMGAGAVPDSRSTAKTAVVWAPATFVVAGHGWGHGVGLSQYGAWGLAKHSKTYDQIISFYFPGTDLTTVSPHTIRVLLADAQSSITFASTTSFRVTDKNGTTYDVANLTLTVTPALKVKLAGESKAKALAGPLVFSGSKPFSYDGRDYRGNFRISVVSGKIRLINVVSLEAYLYGVVPSEMPHDWSTEALKSQAVAARSYALSEMGSGEFDVFPDTRSQMYGGITAETPETTAAVKATANQAVYYQGKIASTFFSSSSGGRTAAVQDAWPGSPPVPYLISVKDPYDDISPYHNWGPYVYQGSTLASKLGVSGALTNFTTTSNPSRRVSTATATDTGGGTHDFSGSAIRDALSLRSTWFSVGVLALQRSPDVLSFGSSVTVSGRIHDVSAPVLQVRTYGHAWKEQDTLTPNDAGLVSLTFAPKVITWYRLVSDECMTKPMRISVAPAVRLIKTVKGLRGSVRPARVGSVAELQRMYSGSWKTIAKLPVNAHGAFKTAKTLKPAKYRARVGGIKGLVAGVSPVVVIGKS